MDHQHNATTTTPTPEEASSKVATKRGATYLSISRACSLCKRDHKACNGARPCFRCISSGMADKCEDVVLKTRGRPRKKRNLGLGNDKQEGTQCAVQAKGGLEALECLSGAGGLPSSPSSNNDGREDTYCNNISFYISSFPSPSVEMQSGPTAFKGKASFSVVGGVLSYAKIVGGISVVGYFFTLCLLGAWCSFECFPIINRLGHISYLRKRNLHNSYEKRKNKRILKFEK